MIKRLIKWYKEKGRVRRFVKAMNALHAISDKDNIQDLKEFVDYAKSYYEYIEKNQPPQHFNCRCHQVKQERQLSPINRTF